MEKDKSTKKAEGKEKKARGNERKTRGKRQEAVVEEQQQTSQEQVQEYMEGWKRALADYENLKKQTEQDRAAFQKYACQTLIEDLIPTLDYFDAAMSQLPDLSACDESTRKQIDNWLQGVKHVQTLLVQQLTDRGVTTVPTDGAFDAEYHEAVEEQESDEPEGTILKVVANGYKLHDQLLRPARVIVSKKKA